MSFGTHKHSHPSHQKHAHQVYALHGLQAHWWVWLPPVELLPGWHYPLAMMGWELLYWCICWGGQVGWAGLQGNAGAGSAGLAALTEYQKQYSALAIPDKACIDFFTSDTCPELVNLHICQSAFWMASSVLGCGVSEFVCTLLFFYNPLTLPELSPTDFQSLKLWGLIVPVPVPRAGLPVWGFEPLTPQGPLHLWCLSHLCVAAPSV